MTRLVLGLDIGITSVGYGVIDIDENRFVDYGVRLFKEGTAADNEKRRNRRGARRLIRRKKNRLLDMKDLLKELQLMSKDYHPNDNPYELRARGLKEELTNNELCAAILHITKHRGSSLETVEDNDEENEKVKGILRKNSSKIKEGKYVCEIQLEQLYKYGYIRGIENNFKTDHYVDELRQILSNQNINDDAKERILKLVERRRHYDEGPGSEKSPTPYGRWYIDDNGEIKEVNLIDKMRGKCSVYPDELRAPKRSYTAELFNLLNDLNNLTIDGKKITPEKKEEIIKFVDEKGNITVKQLLKLLNESQENVQGFRINKSKKPILTEFKGYRTMVKIFKEHHCFDLIENKDVVDTIIEILTKTKVVEERKELIKKKFHDFDDMLLNDLANTKGVSGYHSLSFKAMKEINEEMKQTEMNQMQILYQSGLFGKNRVSTKGQKYILPDDQAILSPVAKRAHREAFKVINALRDKYGEFDSIVIETTRIKNSDDEKRIEKEKQKRFENNNKKVDELLVKNGKNSDHINAKTKMKLRLYLEQDGKSAYTLQDLDINRIITDPEAYEIDHIIPLSVSLDDSFHNKVLSTKAENQKKGKNTPIGAYWKGNFDDLNFDINKYQTFVKNSKNISKKKKEYLLFKEDITRFDVIEQFINRNLVDTSYACRSVMNTLQHYFKDNDIDTKVHTIKGSATNVFRNRIHLKKDRDDYYHHAIDALIVASLKKMNLINSYLMKVDLDKMYDETTKEVFPIPSDGSYLDPKYISFVSDLKNIYEETKKYSLGVMTREQMHYPPIKISHKVDTKPNRKVADETIYSTRYINGEEKLVEKYGDIYDPKFKHLAEDIINGKKEKYIMAIKDPQTFSMIERIIMDHFNQYKDASDIYQISKKEYKLKGENPLSIYKQESGKIHKYSKKGNGPEITSMKYYSETLGNHIDITNSYNSDNKRVVLKQISPYRSDFYISPNGKYNFVTIRYKDVFYSKSKKKYCIDKRKYEDEKLKKKIDDSWKFVCSLHHDELIGITKKKGQKFIYYDGIDKKQEESKEEHIRYHDGKQVEILKFTATNDDKTGRFEVKPISSYCKKPLKVSVGTCILIQKYATDVLGKLYKVEENVLKLEFD